MKKFGAALIAVAGLASLANAQAYTIETRWVAITTTAANGGVGTQLANNAVVDKTAANDIDLQRAGAANAIIFAQRFQLQARVTNVTGQAANLGVLAIRGDFSTSNGEGAFANPNGGAPGVSGLGDRTPFNFGPATESFRNDGAVSTAAQVDQILNASSDRDAFPQFTWGLDGAGAPLPMPTAPAGLGIDPAWAPIYQVLVQVLNGAADRSFDVSFAHSDSRGLQSWSTVPGTVTPPNEDNPSVVFNYLGLQMQGARTQVNSSFKINLVPAPASAALLGLGGLVATRRRRA